MKKILLAIALLVITIVGCSNSSPTDNTTPVEVVFDVKPFAGISSQELIEKMGEPESTEDWNYESAGLTYPITTYLYNDRHVEFLLNNDKVMRISVFADSYFDLEGSQFSFTSKDDILEMFGLTENDVKYAKKTDTNSALRYENFGNIRSFWIPSYEDNAFDEVKVDFSDLFL